MGVMVNSLLRDPYRDALIDGALYLAPRPVTTLSSWADRHRVLTPARPAASPGAGAPPARPTCARSWTNSAPPRRCSAWSSSSPSQPARPRSASTGSATSWSTPRGPCSSSCRPSRSASAGCGSASTPCSTPPHCLRSLFDARSKRDAGNAEDLKDFPGGMLVIGGANSPASLASMPIRYVLCDEVDRFPWEAGKEGDPLGLIDERTKTFPRRKVMLVSTPTVAGLSRIDDEYQASDQRTYQVPCPHCGTRQELRWRGDDGEYNLRRSESTGAVWYRCIACEGRIEEHHKTHMLAAGLWVAKHPERPVRGYHLTGLYSPIGLGFTWSELLDQWAHCQHDIVKLKRFINTTLGETWEEQGDSLDAMHLMARLEDYPDPMPARLRTVGVDVQKDRLELTVIDVGVGEEVWVLDHLILPGRHRPGLGVGRPRRRAARSAPGGRLHRHRLSPGRGTRLRRRPRLDLPDQGHARGQPPHRRGRAPPASAPAPQTPPRRAHLPHRRGPGQEPDLRPRQTPDRWPRIHPLSQPRRPSTTNTSPSSPPRSSSPRSAAPAPMANGSRSGPATRPWIA